LLEAIKFASSLKIDANSKIAQRVMASPVGAATETKAASRDGQATKRKLGSQDDSPQALKRAQTDSLPPDAVCQFFVIVDGKTKCVLLN
jgi:hypothetical protein